MASNPATALKALKIFTFSSSKAGLCSVSTLIVGETSAVLVDPTFTIPDAKNLLEWIKTITSNTLTAIFVSHHHPDHFWGVDVFLDEYPSAKFYAAPYVVKGIDAEYDTKAPLIHTLLGHKVTQWPARPDPYPWSFFLLDGNYTNPVILLGPVQGDCSDCTLFWLPQERTIICGDVVFGSDAHVWCAEIENHHIHQAWVNTLSLIDSLQATTIIPGHKASDITANATSDVEHTRNYLAFFKRTILDSATKLLKAEIIATFQEAFPQCNDTNGAFFLEHLGIRFGKENLLDNKDATEPFVLLQRLNRAHGSGSKSAEELEGFQL